VNGADRTFDVAVVGFGPVGAVLAGLCARRGLDVVVLERDTEVFPLPRAVQIDHEGLRILQEIGCADEILDGSILNDGISFLTADRRTLMSATVPPLAPTGWPASVFFHQPTFEAVLRRTVEAAGSTCAPGSRSTRSSRTTTGSTCTWPTAMPSGPATPSGATGPGR